MSFIIELEILAIYFRNVILYIIPKLSFSNIDLHISATYTCMFNAVIIYEFPYRLSKSEIINIISRTDTTVNSTIWTDVGLVQDYMPVQIICKFHK